MKLLVPKILTAIMIFAMPFIFSACKKDDSPGNGSHKVYFKATASAGCNISIAVYGYDGNMTTKTGLSGTTWQSEEFTISKDVQAVAGSVTATGVDASSSLTIECFVDGKKVSENTGTGPHLQATTGKEF